MRFSPILVKLKTFQNRWKKWCGRYELFCSSYIIFFFRWNEVLRTQLVAILTKVMNFELYFVFRQTEFYFRVCFKSCMCCCEYCFKTVSLIEEKYRDILYCVWFLTTSIDYCVFYFFLDWYTLIIVNQIDICAFHWICIEIIQTIINTLNFKADYDQHVLVLAQLKALVLPWLE